MIREEQAGIKIKKLVAENIELTNYVHSIETEYGILTDQYMNGNIAGSIGRQQRYLEKIAYRHKKRIEKNNEKIFKLRRLVEGH